MIIKKAIWGSFGDQELQIQGILESFSLQVPCRAQVQELGLAFQQSQGRGKKRGVFDEIQTICQTGI